MLSKLAVRNVRRQIGNYVIYFITVSLTVALMFAVNSAIFEEHLVARADDISELRAGLIAITVLVSLIVSFVLGYATSFMLKLRKREFGTYLTLGMTRKNIITVFLLESLILCALSLAAGIVLGLVFYQGIMAIITNIMDVPFAFAAYSLKGLLLTVALVLGVFALSSVTSAAYLKRVSIYDLLHGAKKQERAVKHPAVWFAVTAVSLAGIIASCIVFSYAINNTIKGTLGSNNGGLMLLFSLLILSAALILFHIGLAKSIVNLLLKSKRFKNSGTNAFTLRGLSGKLSSNAVMAGVLSFLIAFAVIGSNVSFVQQISTEEQLKKRYPFDIFAAIEKTDETHISIDEAEKIISEYAEIEKRYDCTLYTSKDSYLHRFTEWYGNGYGELYDTFISESDFNRIYAPLGYSPIELNGGFKIIPAHQRVETFDFSQAVLNIGGEKLPFKGFSEAPTLGLNYYFQAIVPDSAIQSMFPESDCVVFDLKNNDFDAMALRSALSYEKSFGGYSFFRCDFNIIEHARIIFGAENAVFIVSALYIAVVFVFMAMAILALKTLSGVSEDKLRYNALYKLGASKREQARALFKQTFAFFFLPFALPILLSIPAGVICAQIMALNGLAGAVSKTLISAGLIALVMSAIYVLYFTATYLLTKRTVIKA